MFCKNRSTASGELSARERVVKDMNETVARKRMEGKRSTEGVMCKMVRVSGKE